jgi:hypothetical protein
MRLAAIVVAAAIMTSGCATLLTPAGSAADRWEAIEKVRALRLADAGGQPRICKEMPIMGSNLPQKIC